MDRELVRKAISRFLIGVVLVGMLLFLPAGTPAYWNGWLLMGLLFVPMFVAGLVLLRKRPELLRSRLEAKEKQKEQDSVIAWSALMFLVGFLLCGFNYRFGWMMMPRWLVLAAAGVFLCAYGLYAEVLRETVWLSRTVQVQVFQQALRQLGVLVFLFCRVFQVVGQVLVLAEQITDSGSYLCISHSIEFHKGLLNIMELSEM